MATKESSTGYQKAAPVIHPENRTYWESLKSHELRLQKCMDCGTVRYPISPVCHKCFSSRTEWSKLSGRGRVSVFVTVVEATGSPAWAKDLPYNVALVDLEEGPRVTANIVGIKNEKVYNGMPVEAVFEDVTPELTLLKFKPRG